MPRFGLLYQDYRRDRHGIAQGDDRYNHYEHLSVQGAGSYMRRKLKIGGADSR